QDVQSVVAGEEAVGEGADARQRCELDRLDAHAGVAGAVTDRIGDSLALGDVARGEDHFGTVRRERPGRLLADAARAPGDEHPLAAEVDALEHLVGGRRRSELRHVPHGAILRQVGYLDRRDGSMGDIDPQWAAETTTRSLRLTRPECAR